MIIASSPTFDTSQKLLSTGINDSSFASSFTVYSRDSTSFSSWSDIIAATFDVKACSAE